MPSETNTGLVNWQYGDWRSQSTLTEKINRLRLHIQEVEKYAFESQSKTKKLRLHDGMLPRLEKNLERLEAQQAMSTNGRGRRIGRVARYKRGSSA